MNRETAGCVAMLILFFLVLATHSVAADSAEKPNFIIILTDDQGYQDLGCYGSKSIKTPHIDQIAAEGVRFTDFYDAAPICSPSRAGLLTGCYPSRIGMANWVQRPDSTSGINPAELTIPKMLKAKGYRTQAIGKWHVGFKPPFTPQRQGFDHYFGIYYNLDQEADYLAKEGGVPILRDETVVKRPADPAELTELYTQEALKFIESSRDQPFFLYLAHTMPHVPLGVSPAFKGKSAGGEYGDVIECLDWSTGQIVQTLRKLKLDQKTIVLFTSDNGPTNLGSALPLRGKKLSTYEGGIRVPCVAWGPGHVAAGKTCHEIASTIDFLPTIAGYVGAELPKGRTIDGKDIRPLLTEPDTAKSPHDAFYYHGSNGELAAIRSGKWKMFLDPQPTLYDLENDIGETKPVTGNAAVVKELRDKVIAFAEDMRRTSRKAGEWSEAGGTTTQSAGTKSSEANASSTKALESAGQGNPAKPVPSAKLKPQYLAGVDAHTDLVFAKYGDRELKLDLYRPKTAAGPLPAVVCIHGGGWFKGDRSSEELLAMGLAARGFVAVTIDYRLSGEAQFPAQIEDCKAAVRWLRANAQAYGIDSRHIGATGLSAGGHLTALLATSGGVKSLEGGGGNAEQPSDIQAAVAMGAQTDLESERVAGVAAQKESGVMWRQFLGGTPKEQPDHYRDASPLHYLDATDPPMSFMSGELDDPSTHADTFRAAMKKLGLATGLVLIPNAPHPFLNRSDWLDQAVDYTASFFTVHLKGQ